MMIRSWRLQHARLAAPIADAHCLRRASTASAPRVLCSAADLLEMRGRALKFPLRVTPLHSPPPSTPQPSSQTQLSSQTQPSPAKVRARRSQALATGFVFFCEETQQVRAFANSCPHARLELDLDDSDFFCEGFLQCKAHGAFFDPQTGMCLQGPTGQRAGQKQKTIPGLPVLDVRVDDSGNVVLVESGNDQQQQRASTHTGHLNATFTPSSGVDDEELSAYRTKRQRELAVALSSRADDVRAIQKALHEKTMVRIQKYKQQQQQVPRTPKGSN